MYKRILYNDDARKALVKGIKILSKVVAITLGPRGKNVVLEYKSNIPQIINDGIAIAKEIELKDQFENMGVQLIRQATSKTNDVVGDGTTTATILASSIVEEGINNISVGFNPLLIKKGMEKAVHFVINKILEYSRPVSSICDIIHIASISAGNDSYVGNIIAKAIDKVGKEGVITLEEGQSTQTTLEITEGMHLDKGLMSPYFLFESDGLEISQDNPLVLLTDAKITLFDTNLVAILEQVAKLGRSLLIIAEDIEQEALSTLVINRLRKIVNVVAVRVPGFGDRKKFFLQDISVLTGAQVISQSLGMTLDEMSLKIMGSAKRVIVSKDSTKIIAQGNEKAIQIHCQQIKKQIESSNNSYEKEKLQERLSKMTGGVAIIKVGAATETEMKNKKLRFEDAVNATRSAIEEGIVPGGGSTLVHLSQDLNIWANRHLFSEELVGAKIISNALLVPLLTIVNNTGQNGSVIVEQVKSANFCMGYDAEKNRIVDMYSSGIVDSAKVTRSALQNAASIASMILTTECAISSQWNEKI